jgi:tRNA(Ile)-lysidine synthase
MTSAVVAIRNAVRPYLELREPGDTLLVAVSGGADSLALADALVKEARPLALNVIGITIDHQLQERSHDQALRVLEQLTLLGYESVVIRKVSVIQNSGVEADARKARYEAFDHLALELNAKEIYLGHTRDDQAETVLLGLARGSGTRSLSGMAPVNGKYIRPLLAITREQTVAACKEINLQFWSDPHNENLDFSRVRVRNEVLPVMEKNLGPGIAAALARSASLFRDDADALDQIAAQEAQGLDLADLDCQNLLALPRAIRTRIIKNAIYGSGAPSGSISADHIAGVEALVTSWHGQGEISLPGGVKVRRISGRLSLLARE